MKNFFIICAIAFSFFGCMTVSASEISGTIDAGFKSTKVCHSADCLTPIPGVINFRPTGTTPISISDTSINGIAWGNELGWITMNPTGPEGVTVNPSTGVLSGKAWSQMSGWINFAPTGQGVSITAAGELSGWAWVGGTYGGWIKFNCADSATCVKTDWRPISARTATVQNSGSNGPVSSGGGGGNSPNDICWNIADVQLEVPSGMILTGQTTCEKPPIDVCPNVLGNQSEVPKEYTQDEGGLCFLIVDYCPNIPDIQYGVPAGYNVNNAGQCLVVGFDACPLIPGIQSSTDECRVIARPKVTTQARDTAVPLPSESEQQPVVPKNKKTITPKTLDVCANLNGQQSEVPKNYTQDHLGACIPIKTDYCPNMKGLQTSVPKNYFISTSGECVLYGMKKKTTDSGIKNITNFINSEYGNGNHANAQGGVIGFTFVPGVFQIPLQIKGAASLVRTFTNGSESTFFVEDTDPTNPAPKVDIIGLVITLLVVGAAAVACGFCLQSLFFFFLRGKI